MPQCTHVRKRIHVCKLNKFGTCFYVCFLCFMFLSCTVQYIVFQQGQTCIHYCQFSSVSSARLTVQLGVHEPQLDLNSNISTPIPTVSRGTQLNFDDHNLRLGCQLCLLTCTFHMEDSNNNGLITASLQSSFTSVIELLIIANYKP